ncbi:hypothetical protein K8640_27360 [Myxococcus sp. XM-1-1-1]|uniref:Dickkopf N-terminal cysteine-rich domain-containing protein n=1 Tax=Myxococcus sp. XM-1-1-1 TaxID=2874602 RepID=UPI001CBD54EB|nr:Dickkopf N-terminal cysteine-rich domain-containing protein [Myxococcus sp. XM-1-1-1]MBZ4411941.1 hypothetical protein [Myxococcus sp. XM-1-1-1]BDT30828.1 hypothetical protein MFMH1_04970 [Myxococcus sp. MH1]
MRDWRAVLGVMLLGLWACGGDEDVSMEDFGTQVVQALCARAQRCGEYVRASACEDDMRQWNRPQSLGLGTRYEDSLESGRLRFDGAAAQRCLDALRGRSCSEPALSDAAWQYGIEYEPACQLFVQQGPASGCGMNLDCGSEAYCGHTSQNACEGTCTPRGAEGQAVTHPWKCAPGLVFEGSTRTCMKPVEENVSCVRQHPNGTSFSLPCAQGLWCDWNGYRTCRPVGAEGDVCEDVGYYPCGPSLVCNGNRCAPHVKEGHLCNAPPYDVSLGFLVTVCQRELFCDADPSNPGLCRPRRAERQECRLDTECQEGMWCKDARPEAGVWGICVKATGPDDACDNVSRFCPRGYACLEGSTSRCLPIVHEGERCGPTLGLCDFDNSCVSGRCVGAEASSCQ